MSQGILQHLAKQSGPTSPSPVSEDLVLRKTSLAYPPDTFSRRAENGKSNSKTQ